MKTAIIDTIPKDARNQGSVNLGYEIVAEMLEADRYRWDQTLNGHYDQVAFNVFYPTHLFNVVPFLAKNGIEPLRAKRTDCKVIAGGQGIGRNRILSEIANEVYEGELDFEQNATQINSDPIIRSGSGVVELTRGCKRKCKFCEYSATVRPYREKPISLVIEQIERIRFGSGVKAVNFLSANLAGYSQIETLIEETLRRGVRILNTDSCLADIHKLYPFLRYLPKYFKIGVESFDEKTRARIGKPFSDETLWHTVESLLNVASTIHFYLIYGLPGDDYSKWLDSLKTLASIRSGYTRSRVDLFGFPEKVNTKNIRYELSITNFEPCPGTAFENENLVDFNEKEQFIKLWGAELMRLGFFVGETFDYKNTGGRIGRKQLSYDLLMALKHGGPEITEELIGCYPRGISRSISDDDAAKFLFYRPREIA